MRWFAIPKASLWGAFLFCAWAQAVYADAPLRARVAVDGDTILLTDGRLVRLIGINTPELADKAGTRPAQPLALAAQAKLQGLIDAAPIELRYEVERHDRFGRVLAHVFARGVNVEAELLRAGLAAAIAIPPNVAFAEDYLRLEHAARTRGLGLWGEAYYAPIAASALRADDVGFRFIYGRVQAVKAQRYGSLLLLAPHVSLYIPRADRRYFTTPPAAMSGKMISARGWLTARDDALRMKIQHPAMLAPNQRATTRP